MSHTAQFAFRLNLTLKGDFKKSVSVEMWKDLRLDSATYSQPWSWKTAPFSFEQTHFRVKHSKEQTLLLI